MKVCMSSLYVNKSIVYQKVPAYISQCEDPIHGKLPIFE